MVGTIAAGAAPGARLAAGTALRIMTGAPIPEGADRVVPIEDTDRGKERVTVRVAPEAGAHVRRRGEVVEKGAPLLPAGTLLTPGALALIATHGYDRLPVVRAPRVAILTTGDEVVAPERDARARTAPRLAHRLPARGLRLDRRACRTRSASLPIERRSCARSWRKDCAATS